MTYENRTLPLLMRVSNQSTPHTPHQLADGLGLDRLGSRRVASCPKRVSRHSGNRTRTLLTPSSKAGREMDAAATSFRSMFPTCGPSARSRARSIATCYAGSMVRRFSICARAGCPNASLDAWHSQAARGHKDEFAVG